MPPHHQMYHHQPPPGSNMPPPGSYHHQQQGMSSQPPQQQQQHPHAGSHPGLMGGPMGSRPPIMQHPGHVDDTNYFYEKIILHIIVLVQVYKGFPYLCTDQVEETILNREE